MAPEDEPIRDLIGPAIKFYGLLAVIFLVVAWWFISGAWAQNFGPIPQVSISTNVPTYTTANPNIANSNATDLWCIAGGIGKTIFVNFIHANAIASAAAVLNVTIVKRSTLDSGGTPTTETIVPLNSSNPTPVATVTSFIGSPSLGTAVGNVAAHKVQVATTSNANTMNDLVFTWGDIADQPLTLRGPSESACINVPATAGGSWAVYAKWTEQ